jgi:PLP dependent protein
MTLETTRVHIQKTIDKYNKNKNPVTLLAASKSQDRDTIEQAINAGITHFGENRVQEAASKWPGIKSLYPAVSLHLIGPLQSNKVDQALEIFDVIQTVDRPKLAETLVSAMKKTNQHVPCYIQVNTGKEPQKAGILPEKGRSIYWLLP